MIFSVTVRRVLLLLVFFTSLVCSAQDSLQTNDAELETVLPDSVGQKQESSITVRVVPQDVTGKMKKEKDFSYANDSTFWKAKPAATPAFLTWLNRVLSSKATQLVFYLILTAVLVFVLYQIIVVNKFALFSRSGKNRAQQEGSANEDVPIDLDKDLANAIGNGNYRLAIRLFYLLTLNRLSANQEIKLQAMATNHDYIRQMRSSPRYQDFTHLTNMYEYVWYGEFEPNNSQFENMRDHFIKFNNQS